MLDERLSFGHLAVFPAGDLRTDTGHGALPGNRFAQDRVQERADNAHRGLDPVAPKLEQRPRRTEGAALRRHELCAIERDREPSRQLFGPGRRWQGGRERGKGGPRTAFSRRVRRGTRRRSPLRSAIPRPGDNLVYGAPGPGSTHLKVDGVSLTEALFYLRDGMLGMPVKEVEIADSIAFEERARHGVVESEKSVRQGLHPIYGTDFHNSPEPRSVPRSDSRGYSTHRRHQIPPIPEGRRISLSYLRLSRSC